MIQNKNYKRKTRQLSDRTKQLISQKLKGKSKPASVCAKISSSMKAYWETVGNNTDTEDNI